MKMENDRCRAEYVGMQGWTFYRCGARQKPSPLGEGGSPQG